MGTGYKRRIEQWPTLQKLEQRAICNKELLYVSVSLTLVSALMGNELRTESCESVGPHAVHLT